MICPKCGSENNIDAKFCIKCGNNLSLIKSQGEQNTQNINNIPTQNNTNVISKQSENIGSSEYLTSPIPNQNINNIPTQNNTNVMSKQSENIGSSEYLTSPIPNQSINNNSNQSDTNVMSKQSENIGSSEYLISPIPNQNINNNSNQNEKNYNSVSSSTSNKINKEKENYYVSFISYFYIILAVILKPFTTFKEQKNLFNNFKNSTILSLIVAVGITLISLIKSMLAAVRVKKFDWMSGGYTTSWTWENLKNLDYIQIILKNFLICLGAMLIIASIYYIASLIIKKQVNFSRLLGIVALSVIPGSICFLILSPLFSLIWTGFTIPFIIVGSVYSALLLYEGINSEIMCDENVKYYLNLICFSVIGFIVYYVYTKVVISSVSGGLGNIFDILK